MMQINRAVVLLTGKIDSSSLCDENKQIFECISERNHFELTYFQFLDNMVPRKEVHNEQKYPFHFEKGIEYNSNKLSDSLVKSTNLKREKPMNVYYHTRQHTRNGILLYKCKLDDEETFSKKLENSAGVDKKLSVEASASHQIETSENDLKDVLRQVKKYLLKKPLSPEFHSYLMPIFCHIEDTLSIKKSGHKTLLANMIFEILKKSPEEPIARQNGIQLLLKFQEYPNLCEEIINDLTKDLISSYVLSYNFTSNGLQLIDETVFLLHSLKKLIEIFAESCKDLNNSLTFNNSEYMEYEKSYNIWLWKHIQHQKVKKWKKRLEKLKKSNYPVILFMVGQCVDLLDNHSE